MTAPDAGSNAAEDPFAHLHDEDYAAAFAARRLGFADRVAMGGREAESLDGEWRFTLDLFDEGLRQRWYANEPSADPRTWTTPLDYDAGQGDSIAVPSCWTCLKPEWSFFEGGAWYTRMIDGALAPGERMVLRVGAAAYEARVFLNGAFLGSHRGGSTPFFVELTSGLRDGPNRLQINVDNRRRPERVPMHHFDWFNHGGIYREVSILRLPAVFMRDVGVALVPDGGFGAIAAEVTLSDPVAAEARLRIPELGVDVAFRVENGAGRVVIAAHPELWSPDQPRLYDVELRCGEDVVRERIGFREVRTQGHAILLNGRPLTLRGVCVHEDDAELGKVSTEADVRRRFAHARDLGCNVLRLAHYPHHEHVARLADQAGLMLWEEIPVYWAIDFNNPETLDDAQNQLLEMIARDRNRASVILWGVGNENADTDARYRFMATLAEAARAEDPTRLISAACLINREQFRIEDRLAAHLDVIGLNEYFGWYEPDFSGLERLIANSHPDRPVVVSETGADALAGHHGSEAELFTEERQAWVIRRQIEILSAVPWICGCFPWLLYDFRSERRQTAFQQGWNRKGLVAQDKTTRKAAYHALCSLYAAMGRCG